MRPDRVKALVIVFQGTVAKGGVLFYKERLARLRRDAALGEGGSGQESERGGDPGSKSHEPILYTYNVPGDETYISRKGYQRLHQELADLKKRRPMIAKAILEAREKGDLKENAEYHAAKEDSAHNERRIQEIEAKLGGARILEDQGELPTDKAYIGATVSVKDEAGADLKFTLVDAAESDPANGFVSVSSPIGQSLLGQPVGATVKVPVGKSGYQLTITAINR